MKGMRLKASELLIALVGSVMIILLSVVTVCLIAYLPARREGESIAIYVIAVSFAILLIIILSATVATIVITGFNNNKKVKPKVQNLTGLTVEEVLVEEIDTVVDFYGQVIDELMLCGNLPCWEKDVYPAKPFVEYGVKTGSLFVVKHDNRVIGAFELTTEPRGDYSKGRWQLDLAEGEYWVIHAFALKKEYQGKGIARDMVRYILNLAKECSVKSVRCDVTLLNGKAMRLYEAMGFKSAGAFDLGRNVKGVNRFQLYEYVVEN